MNLKTLVAVGLVCFMLVLSSAMACGKKEFIEDPFTGKQVRLCSKDAREIEKQMGEIQNMANMAIMQIENAGIPTAERIDTPENAPKLSKKDSNHLFN